MTVSLLLSKLCLMASPELDINLVELMKLSFTDKQVKSWIENKQKKYICVAAVHLVMECQKDKKLLKGVNEAGLVTPDGMPLVWLSKLYGHRDVSRVYGPTLM